MKGELWRVGRKVGRTIYRATKNREELIGVMDTPELARLVVDAVNRMRSTVPNQVAPLK